MGVGRERSLVSTLFFLFCDGWYLGAAECGSRPVIWGQGLQGSIFMGRKIYFLKVICKADYNQGDAGLRFLIVCR